MLLVSIWAVSLLAVVFPATAQAQGGGGNGQQGQNQQADDWSWVNSPNSTMAGQSWDPTANTSGNQGQDYQNQGYQSQGYQGQGYQGQGYQGQGNLGQAYPGQDYQSQDYQGQGNGYDPSQQAGNNGGPRGPYGSDANQGGQGGDNYASNQGAGQYAQGDMNQQNGNWGWVNSDDNPNNHGMSYEPAPSAPKQQHVTLTGEKWIDVSIGTETLVAYQGDTAVRTFVISTGSAAYPTATGTFYTYARYDVQDMYGGSVANGDYYYQPAVPWVQYFYEGFSIHGAYWHNMFATPIGHGCVNMRVEEAKWLYDWTGVTGIRVVVHQ